MLSHVVELVSSQDGRIQAVSVYTGRAEITRLFSFDAEEGQNQVKITGLPNFLEQESIRVEGRGHATIHDIIISSPAAPPTTIVKEATSTLLKELEIERELVRNALYRNTLSEQAFELFIKEALMNLREPSGISAVVDSFNQMGAKVDKEKLKLRRRLDEANEKIYEEQKRIHEAEPKVKTPNQNRRLGIQLGIGVVAEKKGKIELIVAYAVTSVSWDAIYNVGVNTLAQGGCVSLDYKANIKQNSGESWENVELILETNSPSYNSEIPELLPWNLSQYNEQSPWGPSTMVHSAAQAPQFSPTSPGYLLTSPAFSPTSPAFSPASPMPVLHAEPVLGQGNINATFRVPGTMTISDDGQAHSVSVAQLKLDANLEWICVPKVDKKVHLKADILNASDYAFVPGNTSIYVDGSFISKTRLPAVSPGDRFDCNLGLDPTIRVTYHPRTTKKTSKSTFGFGQKTIVITYSQRITMQNAKSSAAESIKVIDQVPVSQDEHIGVRLITPGLVVPSLQKDGDEKAAPSAKEKDSSSIKSGTTRVPMTVTGSSLKTLLSGSNEKTQASGSLVVRAQ
ncbi:mucoidy inhibitor a [Moniliophthora roreri MCA 2997]|uniref:Mucoidy inhibitor a n=2 Tax=Moniliophthora roreri TaxID=221103 RepID=V2XHA5_MONRO|nr:mucoidy inhibitor a [Moniliophthora roreri MCA 2997]KAI3615875.1 mucoidy inhibitor a [Moniliophthora roreri]